QWLVQQGARHLVLLGASTPAADEAVSAMRASGAQVSVLAADVSDSSAMARVLASIREAGPPLRGVFHTAGVLDDAMVLQQDMDRLRRVLAPKVAGTWALHELTASDPLDFFVLSSSAAGLLGSPGQASYSAANAFLDAMAHLRRQQQRPALSVGWGPFAAAGLAAAEKEREERFAHRGFDSLQPEEGLAVLSGLLGTSVSYTSIVRFNVRQWVEFYPRLAQSSMLSRLLTEAKKAGSTTSGLFLETLRGAPALARGGRLEQFVREQMAAVLRLDVTRIDRDTPFKTLGFDSLMGLELRNRLESALGLKLSATMLYTHTSVAPLGQHLLARLFPADAVLEPSSTQPDANEQDRLAQLEKMSSLQLAAEVDAVLAKLE
ncbi:MAG TPA: beta-ketoacyl reductase, partial [Candidatus Xenobia bacterium]